MIQETIMTWIRTIDPMKVAKVIKMKSIETLVNQRAAKGGKGVEEPLTLKQ